MGLSFSIYCILLLAIASVCLVTAFRAGSKRGPIPLLALIAVSVVGVGGSLAFNMIQAISPLIQTLDDRSSQTLPSVLTLLASHLCIYVCFFWVVASGRAHTTLHHDTELHRVRRKRKVFLRTAKLQSCSLAHLCSMRLLTFISSFLTI